MMRHFIIFLLLNNACLLEIVYNSSSKCINVKLYAYYHEENAKKNQDKMSRFFFILFGFLCTIIIPYVYSLSIRTNFIQNFSNLLYSISFDVFDNSSSISIFLIPVSALTFSNAFLFS